MKNKSWMGLAFLVLILFVSFGFFLFGLVLFIATTDRNFFDSGDIAVLNVEGKIIDSDPIVHQIRQLSKDEGIKAVVVRINSPGGTIGGSQEIYQEIKKLDEKKPVVASMGTVAASGGYYIACGAQKILANPGTITGSIGVLFEYVNVEDLVHWMKLQARTFKSGRLKDLASPLRPMTSEEQDYLQETLKALHGQFKEVVATERDIAPEKLEKFADGRFLTGEQALNYHLIDQLGTIEDAIDLAAKLAGIKGEPEVVYPKKERLPWIDLLLDSATESLVRKLSVRFNVPSF